ncbi:sulfotransferase [Alteromonas sp. KUL49]|uniref:sulfotransferase family protein n=1 Tax=Alteromonas sp. KUL49 TaxID=2480798 RepID=UPI00102F0FDC|nr:sulfotransferase [Alteromonas sp. KUL49]TAP40328.1 sulfotransferase [Alteromonas sp. KUL49]GEA11473.1 hypothetical protein KUL49_18480 [Alteromonas sp. KUL49]
MKIKYNKHSKLYHAMDYVINPIGFADQVCRNFHDRNFVSENEFLFVVGAPRSGTTILYKTIRDRIDLLGFEFETEILSQKRLSNYERYKKYIPKETFDKLLDETKSNCEFLDCLHQTLGEGCYVEKTPQHIFSIKKIKKSFPKAKIIHIVRDPRDAFISGFSAKNIPQAKNIKSYFSYWRKCIDSIKSAQLQESDILTVRYEDFVVDDHGIVKNIGDFIGLKVEGNITDCSIDERGLLDEFAKLNKPIDAKSVGRWRESKDSALIQEAALLHKNVLESYGYIL